jgi:hypothetical protein
MRSTSLPSALRCDGGHNFLLFVQGAAVVGLTRASNPKAQSRGQVDCKGRRGLNKR